MSMSPVKLWRNQKQIVPLLGTVGKVVSYTYIRVPPQGFESQAPYPIVLVRIGKNMHIGQLVDANQDELKVDQQVVAVLRRVFQPDAEGVIPYGVKFKPIRSNHS